MRSLIQVTLALLLCWGTNGLVTAGEPPSPIISAPSLDSILNAPRQPASDTDYVFVRLSEDSSCGTVAWRKTVEYGPIFGHASFCLPDAWIWCLCCPRPNPYSKPLTDSDPIPKLGSTESCCMCEIILYSGIQLQITLSDPVYLAEQNLPLIRVPFRAPSKGIVIVTASVDVKKGSEIADLSRIDIGISLERENPADLKGKMWEFPSNKTKSKNRRFVSMQKQLPVMQDRVTMISLYGRNRSGDSDVYIQGRTLFVTFIPDVDSNQGKSDDVRQDDQKNK